MSVVGSAPSLGLWVPENALAFKSGNDGLFTNEVEVVDASAMRDIQYKYLMTHGDERKIEWESGENRRINLDKYFN